MGPTIGVIIAIYFVIAFISSIGFWAVKTDRSQDPFQRRLIGLGYGLIWPFALFRLFKKSGKATAQQQDLRAAHDRIIGGAGTAPSSPPANPPSPTAQPPRSGGQSSIKNPFDA